MNRNQRIGIIVDNDFATKHIPPYPRPTFLSYENPLRIKSIFDSFEKINLWEDNRIVKIKPYIINNDILQLAHTQYYINTVERFSRRGGGLLNEEIYITEDTFFLAKKAIGGAITSIEKVIKNEINQTIALIRPPGHHALRETGSGLCIFNNIANSVLYLRNKLNYKKKIAIIDIDDHFGDGLVQYFYDDPSVLYFSVHEFDFLEGDLGDIDELGEGSGLGTSINFPIPMGTNDEEFLTFMDILEPILRQFMPDIIIIAAGFDMHFADPIGNCNLTSLSYFQFTKQILKVAKEICEGKLIFILEGGYSLIALPYCLQAVIKALLNDQYVKPSFENITFLKQPKIMEISKVKFSLKELLKDYWTL
jgi:acetoin utilization deacetylase AcuC-like enzyme